MKIKRNLTRIIAGTALIFSGINSPVAQEVGQRMPEEFDEKYKVFSRVWLSDDGTKIGKVRFYQLPERGVNYEGRIFFLACEQAYIIFSIYDERENKQFIDNMTVNKRGERVNESDGIVDELRISDLLHDPEDLPSCHKNQY